MTTLSTGCSYDYGFDNGILYLMDLNGSKSLTNGIEDVLNDLITSHGLEFVEQRIIVYRDSEGMWDGVTPKIRDGRVHDVDFWSITETDFERAKTKALERMKA